jgi:hypothetical protein
MKLPSKKSMVTGLVALSLLGVFGLYTNATSKVDPFVQAQETAANLRKTSYGRSVLALLAEAKALQDASDRSLKPGEKKRYAASMKLVKQKMVTLQVKAGLLNPVRGGISHNAYCEVQNTNCPTNPSLAKTRIMIDTTDKLSCLDQARYFHEKCRGGGSTATFYENGVFSGSVFKGPTCAIFIRDCPTDPDMIGSFTETSSIFENASARCLDRATYWQMRCHTKASGAVTAAYYINNGLIGSRTMPPRPAVGVATPAGVKTSPTLMTSPVPRSR